MKRSLYLLGFVSTFMLSMGLLLKLMHWPGASITLCIGFGFLNFGVLPVYFYNKYKNA